VLYHLNHTPALVFGLLVFWGFELGLGLSRQVLYHVSHHQPFDLSFVCLVSVFLLWWHWGLNSALGISEVGS
jgi:hypothetical protein